ncbi:wdr-23, partial [Pristionchus pacificus]
FQVCARVDSFMGGLLSLVLPYNIFNLSSNRSLLEHREESPDILLAAIRLVDPRIAFYTQVSQNLPPHSAVRRIMEEELKKHDEDRELTYDELDRITSEEEEELESSDSECSCDWEEYTDDEDVDLPQSLPLTDEYKFIVNNERDYRDLASISRGDSGYRDGEKSGGDHTREVVEMRRRQEMGGGRGKGGRALTQGRPMSTAEKANLVNKFFPNRRRHIALQTSKVFGCNYLPRQQQLAVSSQERTIRFYGRTAGKFQLDRSIEAPNVGWTILDLSFTKDGETVAYATWNECIYLARLNERSSNLLRDESDVEWRLIPVCVGNRNSRLAVFSVRFSQDDRDILCGNSDSEVYVIDVERATKKIAIPAHADDTNCVMWGDNDPNIFLTAGDDGLCKVWDARTLDAASLAAEGEPIPVGTFAGHRDGITSIDTRGDGRYVLTNSKDQTIKIWDVRRFSSYDAINNTRAAVSRQDWDYRWQPCPAMRKKPLGALAGDSSIATLRGHSILHTLVRARWSPARTGNRYIYTGCARGDVVVYDTVEMRPMQRLSGHKAIVRDVIWAEDANEIFTTSWDGGIGVWQWDERKIGEDQAEKIKARRIRVVRNALREKRKRRLEEERQ